MTRRTMPEPKRLAEVTIERRHITAFSELLTALGMGDVRVGVDDSLAPLLEQAALEAVELRERLKAETVRANRLQDAFNAVAPPVSGSDYSHHVQWRAVDGDEGVVIRGEWTPVSEEALAKQFLATEMVAADRDDLHAQRLVRCGHFSITSIATPDEQQGI